MLTMRGIEVGDYVRLLPRERPYEDGADWWWQVVAVTEYGLDCQYRRRYMLDTFTVAAVRNGVGQEKVRAHRKPNQPVATLGDES